MKKNTKNNNQAIDAQELFLAMNDLSKKKDTRHRQCS